MTRPLVEALTWALAEINGETRYSAPEQRANALAQAENALAAHQQAAISPDTQPGTDDALCVGSEQFPSTQGDKT